MADQPLLNNETYRADEHDLPCLIHYLPKTGGSHFSVVLAANLFLSGSKLLMLTAYPMAKDNFLQQVSGKESDVAYVTDERDLHTNARAVILESGNEQLFLQAIKALDDVDSRVVFIKNIEVFGDETLRSCLNFRKLILSGNLDECALQREIGQKQYTTTVLFNAPKVPLAVAPPKLEQYVGYLWGENEEGFVSVRMEE